MKRENNRLSQLKWLLILWAGGVGGLFLLSLLLRMIMNLAGLQH